MTADRYHEAARLFLEARALPPSQRPALLNAHDPGLRAHVEAMLRAEDSRGTIDELADHMSHKLNDELRTVVEKLARTTPKPAQPPPPARIGKYVILEKLGEGGFGVVYAAEQREPIRRRVAVKVLRSELASREIVTRFEAERQALAMLDHPNVAKVYEAGTTDDGRPYFAMEHVPGVPITEYCDVARLPTRERLNLFIPVCRAVQHAHHKGIIHRDLKPSNVIVTLFDQKPVPKVIDFGIAKAIHAPLTDRTLHTEAGRLLGTPEYMSPEQATTGGLDVDTRTDVYSLGVLLYQLLTGMLPLEPRILRKAGFDAMVRLITELEPPRPSTRISAAVSDHRTRAASLTPPPAPPSTDPAPAPSAPTPLHDPGDPATLAQRRATDLRSWINELRGDLDLIVIKAMAKERSHRYESPGALADDILRSLRTEPILARPPAVLDRLRRFARRNRPALIATAAVCLGAIAGLSGIVFGYVEAVRQRDKLEQALEIARSEQLRATAAEETASKTAAELAARNEELRLATRDAVAKSAESERLLYTSQLARAREAIAAGDAVAARSLLDQAPKPQRAWEWAWLQRQAALTRVILRHPDASHTTNAAFSPDAQLVVTTHEDGKALVWNAATGDLITTYAAHTGRLQHAVFTRDSATILSCGADPYVRIWNARTGKTMGLLRVDDQETWSVSLNPAGDIAATASEDGHIRLWNWRTGTLLRTLKGHAARAWSATFSPDGSTLVTTSIDGSIRRWNPATGEPLNSLTALPAWPWTARYSPDGKQLVVGAYDGSVSLLDSTSLATLRSLTPHTGEVFRAEFNPAQTLVVSGADEERIQLHNPATGELVRTLVGHTAKIRSVAFGPTGDILSASADGTAMIWRDPAAASIALIQDTKDRYAATTLTPDAKTLIAAGYSIDLNLFDLDSAKLIRRILAMQTSALAVDPTSQTVLVGGDSALLTIDLATGNLLARAPIGPGWVQHVAFSPDGSLTAAAWEGRPDDTPPSSPALEIKSRATNARLALLITPATVKHFEFTPDSSRLYAITVSGDLLVVRVPDAALLATIPHPSAPSPASAPPPSPASGPSANAGLAVRVLADPARVIAAYQSGDLITWDLTDLANPAIRARFTAPRSQRKAFALSPDRTRLLVAGGQQLSLLDAATGEPHLTQQLPVSNLLSADFVTTSDPARPAIAVTAADGTIALLELDPPPRRAARARVVDRLHAAIAEPDLAARPLTPADLVARLESLDPADASLAHTVAAYTIEPWWRLGAAAAGPVANPRALTDSPAQAAATIRVARDVVAAHPTDHRALAGAATAMLVTGEFAGAAAIAEQVIVLRKSQSLPPMPGPLAVLATCAHIQGRAAEARVHLAAARAALEAAPWTQDQHWLVQHATNVLEERHDGHMREDSPP